MNLDHLHRTQYEKSIMLSWLFPIYYIFAQYSLPVFSIGTWLLLILLVESLMKKYLIINKYILIFFVYTMVLELTFHVNSLNINSILNMLFSIIFISTFSYKIDMKIFYKAYKYLGSIFSITIIIQFIQIFILKQTVKSSISIFPALTRGIYEWERYLNRPSSFFSEPQAYASYIIPLIILSLKEKNIKISLFFTFCIILSTSSQGIITIGIIWLIFANKLLKGTFKKALLNGAIIISSLLFFSLPIFEFARSKILDTDFSDNVRLTRGFETYSNLPLINKIFGIGFLNQENFFENSHINLSWYEGSLIKEFITSASGVIVYFGFVSGIILLIFLIKYYINSDGTGKIFVVVLVLSMLSQNILYNSWFIFYYILAFNIDDAGSRRDLLKIKLTQSI